MRLSIFLLVIFLAYVFGRGPEKHEFVKRLKKDGVKTSKKDGTLTKEKLDKVYVTLLGDQYQFKRKVANNKYVGKKVNFVYKMRWD